MNEVCPVCNNPMEPEQEACSSCGYHFLGSTVSFKPVSVESATALEKAKSSPVPQLHVIRGPQTGAVFSLGTESLVVGRNPQCDIFLNDMTVSREHARIEKTEAGYSLTDLNSFNGVWVNNNNVETGILHEGDIVQIGAFCLAYREQSSDA